MKNPLTLVALILLVAFTAYFLSKGDGHVPVGVAPEVSIPVQTDNGVTADEGLKGPALAGERTVVDERLHGVVRERSRSEGWAQSLGSGSLELIATDATGAEVSLAVAITEGVWSLPHGLEPLIPVSVRLGGECAWPLEAFFTKGPDEAPRLDVDQTPRSLVRVLEDGQDAAQFTMRVALPVTDSASVASSKRRTGPRVAEAKVGPFRSPIFLSEKFADTTWLFSTSQHVGAEALLKRPEHGLTTVDVHSAAAIEVTSTGDGPDRVRILVLDEAGSLLEFHDARVGEMVVIDHVSAKGVVVIAKVASNQGEYLEVERETVSVVEGETARVSLDLTDLASKSAMPMVSGSLHVPAMLEAAGFRQPDRLALEYLEPRVANKNWDRKTLVLRRLEGGQSDYEWGPLELRPGRYLMRLSGLGFFHEILVVAGEVNVFNLTVPELSLVDITVVDKQTQAPVRPDSMTVGKAIKPFKYPVGVQSLKDPGSNVSAHVISGPIAISTRGPDGYGSQVGSFTVQPGSTAVVFEVEKWTSLDVDLVSSDGSPVLVDMQWASHIRSGPEVLVSYSELIDSFDEEQPKVEKPAGPRVIRVSVGARLVNASAPVRRVSSKLRLYFWSGGSAKIEFPALPGFDSIEPVNVDVDAGGGQYTLVIS